jgi:hypothetical protein
MKFPMLPQLLVIKTCVRAQGYLTLDIWYNLSRYMLSTHILSNEKTF